MSTLPPHDVPAVFWIDGAGQQQGPEPLATVIERIVHDQIPPSTPVWWQGAVNWAPLDSNAEAADLLRSRLAPAPAPAPAPTEAPIAMSPFSSPAPSESAAPFNSPTAFEPTAFEAPTVIEAPAVVEAPAPTPVFETPAVYEPVISSVPEVAAVTATATEPEIATAPQVTPVPEIATVPEVVVPEPAHVTADAGAFSSNGSSDAALTHAPAPSAVETTQHDAQHHAEPEPVAAPGVQLGDPAELEAIFASLTARSGSYLAEQERVSALDSGLATLVRQGLIDLGFTIEDSLSSDEYHSFRLTAADGSNASLAIQRVPSAPTVAAATERPVSCFVDHVGRASAGLFVADYLTDAATDQQLFTKHLASIVHAAGT